MSIRVLIIEDHAMVGEALAAAIERHGDLDVIGVRSTLASGLDAVRSDPPNVVLMDVRLPDGDGARGTAEVRAESPETSVVLLSALDARSVLARALEAGASGYVHKSRHVEEVIDAIRSAAAGESAFPPDELHAVVRRLRDRDEPAQAAELTPRELEVLRLLAAGQTTDQIAANLTISIHTARNHIRHVMEKLDAHTRLEAVASAVRSGLVDHGPE